MIEQSNESTKFYVGDVLVTKDGQYRTNAVIIAEGVVLTDFGNILKIDMWDIWRWYTLSGNHLEAKEMDYPVDTPLERIEHQIELLNEAKEFLNG